MSTAPLSFWDPKRDGHRRWRIFISHRHKADRALYDDVLQTLKRQGHSVQDMSLPEENSLSGPRGGQLPEMEIQAQVAARIYTSDLLVAPSRPGATRSEWVTWEVQLAAVGYGVPVLFVSEPDMVYTSSLVSEMARLGLRHSVAGRNTQDIVRKAVELAPSRPKWGMRLSESDQALAFRGPPQQARDKIMAQFPFQPPI